EKWCQQLIDARLELLRGRRAKAEKVSQNCAENQQRDDVRAAHPCGMGFQPMFKHRLEADATCLPPLAVRRGHLTQEFKFIEAFAGPFSHCAERIFSNMDRQTCFLAQKLVKAPQQRAAAC